MLPVLTAGDLDSSKARDNPKTATTSQIMSKYLQVPTTLSIVLFDKKSKNSPETTFLPGAPGISLVNGPSP